MNTELRTGNNAAFLFFEMSQAQRNRITERHDEIEERAWTYVDSHIRPISEKILKRFAFKYATDSYTNEQFLDSMLVNAKEMNNQRLTEAITYVIENFCLNGCVNLGRAFAKRPDAFSSNFIEAAAKADVDTLKECLSNYARC